MLGEGLFAPVYESSIMDAETPSVETLIATVLADIQQKGYSSIQPFDIGEVEQRMMQFAEANNITLGSDRLYISAKQLQHCMRTSKKGSAASDTSKYRLTANSLESQAVSYNVNETKRQGRIAHHHADATVPHIVALLGSTFHIAKIQISKQTTK